jgi:DNA polymerase I-like protein with 3'-5' exonuclease and polymerase domains
MQVAGFAYDVERARVLSDALRAIEARTRDTADDAVIAAGGDPIARTKTGGFGTKDLARAFRETLRAPVYFRSTITGNASYGVETLRAYAACADERLRALALSILEWRRARKIRSTYIDSIHIGPDGRVHPTWLNYGAVSGRWACQSPNLMNLPRSGTDPTIKMGGIRSLYIPRAGHVLVIFDKSQLEMRVAAYVTGDETMINACESSDLHATNATLIFGDEFDPDAYSRLQALDESSGLSGKDKDLYRLLKTLRTLAKTSGFAVCYFAEAQTVYAKLIADGQAIKLQRVEAMINRLHRKFHVYFEWQTARHRDSIRTGYLYTPILGRRRWVGHDVSPTEMNFHIQGGAADIMNRTLVDLVHEMRDCRHTQSARLVAQVHDSAVFEVPRADAEAVREKCLEVNNRPIVIRSSGKALEARFPIDIEITERWK